MKKKKKRNNYSPWCFFRATMQWNFLWYQRMTFSPQFLADKPKLLLLVPSQGPPTSPSPFTRQAVHHFYQFLQIPHSNNVLGLCCIESLCDKAELTSLIIVKVTFKRNFIIPIYFVVCMFGMSAPSPFGLGFIFLAELLCCSRKT